MRPISFVEFRAKILNPDVDDSQAEEIEKTLRGQIPQCFKRVFPVSATRQNELQKIAKLSEIQINGDPEIATSNLLKGSGNILHFWAAYYYLHLQKQYAEFALHIDKQVLGKSFAKKMGYPVKTFSRKEGIYWTVNEATLRRFFEPIISERDVRALISITHDVINKNLALEPQEFETSIVDQAKAAGIVQGEVHLQWLTAGILAGIRPNEEYTYRGAGSKHHAELYKEQWRFLEPSNQEWLQDIAENSEDADYLQRLKQSTSVLSAEGHKKHLLIELLLANQRSSPVINDTESVAAHLAQLAEMNCSDNTQAFLEYSKARNQATTGQSELAIQTYFKLKNFGFGTGRDLEVRYHMINASYALRLHDLYGQPDVSSLIRLSPEGGVSAQRDKTNAALQGFDALSEIAELCGLCGVDPENFSEDSIHETVQRLNGPAGAKIIYFYHLENMLQKGLSHAELDHHYGQIIEMLRILSTVPRPKSKDSFFTVDVWYPLVLLYSVAANFQHFDLAERINKTLYSFEDWEMSGRLNRSVQQEVEQGSFLMLFHQLNQQYTHYTKAGSASLESELRNFSSNFSHIRFIPAISQTVNFGMRRLNKSYDSMNDVTAQAKRAVSHWNYMVGGGNIHP